MNYNYILYTGADSISDSVANTTQKNLEAAFTSDGFLYDIDLITGSGLSLVSLNSQTLPEGEPIKVNGTNVSSYFISGDFSGQYFITPEDSFGRVSFAQFKYYSKFRINDLEISPEDVLLYDQKTGSKFILEPLDDETDSFQDKLPDLRSKVHAEYNNASTIDKLFENNNVFFNGQKITKGDYPVVGTTGCFSAVIKDKNVKEIFSGEPDYYTSTGFIPEQGSYYINGMEMDNSSFIELYTGMTGIVTGVSSRVVLINEDSTTYTL